MRKISSHWVAIATRAKKPGFWFDLDRRQHPPQAIATRAEKPGLWLNLDRRQHPQGETRFLNPMTTQKLGG
ncbi:hypothetical protein PMG71_01060 [Roseofilum sp. BLCC_M154]|uniref:Ubiquitinyl hydrolase 1 n=1 Tax=Roseofilum acuticapitatum BLCC-M154 TaxID=3022444 RepID=A0ABT7AM96_9CYAN|nr:hypothetical protein [Roseofilum acuticapitatum]MDJ1168011.1 hypothetical protein [Roseofilum acuticapitatum BLCC-M154]